MTKLQEEAEETLGEEGQDLTEILGKLSLFNLESNSRIFLKKVCRKIGL